MKETYDSNELVRLRNNIKKKKAQFEKDINAYENLADKDEEKVTEYEELQIQAEDTFDDLTQYINIKRKRNENKSKKERNEDCKKKLKRRSGNWNGKWRRRDYKWKKGIKIGNFNWKKKRQN